MLVNRLDKIDIEIICSLSDWKKLNLVMFEEYNGDFRQPIITNDFKKVKTYFRSLRKKHYLVEYIYSLELLIKQIKKIDAILIEYNLTEEYKQYLFDFQPVLNKEIVNEYLINFIERYNNLCVKKHFQEVIEYQKKINLEYFHIRHPEKKGRLKILKKWLEDLNNNFQFGNGEGIIFEGFDYNPYCNRLFLLSLDEKKEIFETEIKLIESKLQSKTTIKIESEDFNLSRTSTIDNNYLGQPTNQKANEFFDFLIDYYRQEEITQVKFVNILFYLKNDADKSHFIFKVKQNEYLKIIKEKIGITISKFEKSAKYEEEEKPIFHKLENTFLRNKQV